MSYASLLVLGLMDNIRGPFYPDILNDLALNGTKGSLFFAVASFSALGGNFLGSFLISRWHSHILMCLSILGVGLGFWLIGCSQDFSELIPSCMAFGASFGLLNVSQNVVVTEHAPSAHRRRIFNGLHSMYGFAALAAPLTASLFLDFGFNWSRSFAGIGITSIGLGAVFLGGSLLLKVPSKKILPKEQGRVSDLKSAWLLIFALGFYLLAELSLSTRLPLWLREDYGLGPEAANLYMAYFCGCLLASRLLFTSISFHKISNLWILKGSAFLSILFYVLGLLIHPLLATFSGFFMGPFFPVMMEEMSHRFGLSAAKVIGWSITLGSVMIVLMHFSLGVLTDGYGVSKALWIGPFGLTMTLIFCQVLSLRPKAI